MSGLEPIGLASPVEVRRRRLVARIVLAVWVVLAVPIAALVLRPEYCTPPSPEGMVLRITLGEADPLLGFTVEPAPGGRSALVVHDGFTDETTEYAYPSGDELAVVYEPRGRPTRLPCDLDGDGVSDRLRTGRVVEVISGATGDVIFEDHDPMEYGNTERAFPLGDLDGDGFDELALVHPRMDRSTYDMHLWDAIFPARSWVTVVSGSRLRQ